MIMKLSWLLFEEHVLNTMVWNETPLTGSCVKASAAGTILEGIRNYRRWVGY